MALAQQRSAWPRTPKLEQALRDARRPMVVRRRKQEECRENCFLLFRRRDRHASKRSRRNDQSMRSDKVWADLIATPGFSINWKATKVEVAKSGDIGFISGTYEMTMNDANGKPVNEQGKYLEVWEKQADGKWKCGADIWNSDLPVAPVEKK